MRDLEESQKESEERERKGGHMEEWQYHLLGV